MANKTRTEQEQFVVKANDLIRRTRYNLSTQQQKIVLYAISKIRPEDSPGTQYKLSIRDLCRACGIPIDKEGKYYNAIKEDLQSLTKRLWVQMPDGKTEATVSWIGDAMITRGSGTVYIRFHELMAPFLFELRSHYTQYQLANVLVLRSKHAIRLYELLRSYYTQSDIDEWREKDVRFSVAELRNLLAEDSYPRWADFERYVLRRTTDEINALCSEFNVTYKADKGKGRTITDVTFTMYHPHAREGYEIMRRQTERLTKGL